MPPWITDTLISSLLTFVGVVIGYLITARNEEKRQRQASQDQTTRMLDEAQHDLQKTIDKLNRMWAWNRALQDHIYKGSPPPPPQAPDGLFDD